MNGRERIVEQAFVLFSEKGFASVGIREIADQAGLSNPALYQHFSSKYALGQEIYLRCYSELMRALDARLREEMTPFECLDVYIDAAIHLHKQTPSPLLFLEDEQRRFADYMQEVFGDQTVTARLTRWIEAGRAQGIIRTDIPTRMLVVLTIGQLTKWMAMSSVNMAPKRGVGKWLKQLLRSALSTSTQQ